MSFPDGSRLDPYEIVALLGSGGMGEVYRAHDARLGRDVAIKVLPREFTSDSDRLARLEREARALAALNHPNAAELDVPDRGAAVFAGTLSRITECGLRMSTYSISPLIAKSATFRVERDRRVMREADE